MSEEASSQLFATTDYGASIVVEYRNMASMLLRRVMDEPPKHIPCKNPPQHQQQQKLYVLIPLTCSHSNNKAAYKMKGIVRNQIKTQINSQVLQSHWVLGSM